MSARTTVNRRVDEVIPGATCLSAAEWWISGHIARLGRIAVMLISDEERGPLRAHGV
ncbi:hypothetical protein ACFQ61_18830 [Streptomyces sp. NPDC056500]|uniref:hypothetical protein n=1 Tax=Streptomyces sp. NPDC056500 TaxID=3345840 RepID=UPI00367DD974